MVSKDPENFKIKDQMMVSMRKGRDYIGYWQNLA